MQRYCDISVNSSERHVSSRRTRRVEVSTVWPTLKSDILKRYSRIAASESGEIEGIGCVGSFCSEASAFGDLWRCCAAALKNMFPEGYEECSGMPMKMSGGMNANEDMVGLSSMMM
jgi:hypothetical protein